MNLICKLFGHNWKVYHRKKSRTGTELNKFRKCKRCGKTVKMTESFIPSFYERRSEIRKVMDDGQTIIIPTFKTESTPTHPEVTP